MNRFKSRTTVIGLVAIVWALIVGPAHIMESHSLATTPTVSDIPCECVGYIMKFFGLATLPDPGGYYQYAKQLDQPNPQGIWMERQGFQRANIFSGAVNAVLILQPGVAGADSISGHIGIVADITRDGNDWIIQMLSAKWSGRAFSDHTCSNVSLKKIRVPIASTGVSFWAKTGWTGYVITHDQEQIDQYGNTVSSTPPLVLSSTTPWAGSSVRAQFTVKNIGGQAITIQELAAGARLGSDWNGTWSDFRHVANITLQPGQEYAYDQSRTFSPAGAYFAEPVIQVNGSWGGITGANRVTFTVSTPPCSNKPQGDADCNGSVDLTDFEVWRKEYLHYLTTKNADFDHDGSVTIIDFEVWRRGFLH